MGRYSESVKDSGPAKAKELIFTGKMITADEALRLRLVNKVVDLDTKSDIAMRSSEVAGGVMNKKLMDECIKLGKEITKNSYNAVKVSKMLINKGMDANLETGLRLEIYGWALCFADEDRQTMMSAFLNRGKR